jgi:hypothetical protein
VPVVVSVLASRIVMIVLLVPVPVDDSEVVVIAGRVVTRVDSESDGTGGTVQI